LCLVGCSGSTANPQDAYDPCPACLPCANAANHDEDGDRYDDACDNCPGVSNADQANADGDDAGDACDVDNTIAHHRQLFDGFATISSDWLEIGSAWNVVDDAAVPGSINMATLRHRLVLVTTQTSVIELGVSPESGVGGLVASTITPGGRLACLLGNQSPGAGWELYGGSSLTMVSIHAPVRLRLTFQGPDLRCEVVGVHFDNATPMRPEYPYHLDVAINRGNETPAKFMFSYVDVLTR
jgi:hypothetical protein